MLGKILFTLRIDKITFLRVWLINEPVPAQNLVKNAELTEVSSCLVCSGVFLHRLTIGLILIPDTLAATF